VLGPRWTQLIPKAGEPEDDEDAEAGAEPEAGAPGPGADASASEADAPELDPDAPEPPSGARRLHGEPPPLGSRGTPKPTPRRTRRHATTPSPEPPREPEAGEQPIWKPEPPEPPKSAQPISNDRSRPSDPDSVYAKPKPIPRRARSGRLGRGRVRPPRPGKPVSREPVVAARSAGLSSGRPRERDVFEIASMVFGAIIMIFGLWGAIATIGGGLGSAGFVISVIFFLLGAGRLYMGFRGHRPVAGG